MYHVSAGMSSCPYAGPTILVILPHDHADLTFRPTLCYNPASIVVRVLEKVGMSHFSYYRGRIRRFWSVAVCLAGADEREDPLSLEAVWFLAKPLLNEVKNE